MQQEEREEEEVTLFAAPVTAVSVSQALPSDEDEM